VRFVEIADCSSSNNWDQHGDMGEHAKHAKDLDQPVAGLLRDLKQRGMLDDTLVVWTTEFGRTPGVDGTKGRGHHSACFSSWLAGAGVKAGLTYGSTDENRRDRRGEQSSRARFPRDDPASPRPPITPNSRTVLAGAIIG